MTEARGILPTDILAFVSQGGRSLVNEAWPRERVGSADPVTPLSLALEQFRSLTGGRHVWVSLERQKLQGLAKVRRRGGNLAWEVEYLVDEDIARGNALHLLEKALEDVGRQGGLKLFLRLESDSTLLTAVKEAGFIAYQEETLYALARQSSLQTNGEEPRPLSPSDSYPLFLLYNRVTPEVVRRSEAATFAEWHAALERRWLRGGVQMVWERDGVVSAWIGAARLPQGTAIEILADERALDHADALMGHAARQTGADGQLLVLLPRCAVSLAQRLEQAGFKPQGDFICLMRRTVRTQSLPKAMPAIANTAVGV